MSSVASYWTLKVFAMCGQNIAGLMINYLRHHSIHEDVIVKMGWRWHGRLAQLLEDNTDVKLHGYYNNQLSNGRSYMNQPGCHTFHMAMA
jgi:hypothetical protein